MVKNIKLYIVDNEKKTFEQLESLFYEHPELGVKIHGFTHNFVSCVNDREHAKGADVYLVSAFLPDQMGIDLISKIKAWNPKAKVIILLKDNTLNLGEKAKKMGADDTIAYPYKIRKLLEKIESITGFNILNEEEESVEKEENEHEEENVFYHEHDEENEYLESRTEEKGEEGRKMFDFLNGSGGTLLNKKKESDAEKENRVVSFVSVNSSGKTTLLTNAAMAINEFSDYEPSICIVDLNLVNPSIEVKFHNDELIECKKSIYDVCEDLHYLDESLIKQAMITHEPTGVKLLYTPIDMLRDFKSINSNSIEKLINTLRDMFDLVLIDTSSNIRDERTMNALLLSDKVIVPFEPDVTNLLHTRKLIDTLRDLGEDLTQPIVPKLNYVLNKSNEKSGVNIDIAKGWLGSKVDVEIVDDIELTNASNNGRFVTNEDFKCTEAILDLANIVYPFDKDLYLSNDRKGNRGNKKKSLFGKMFRFKK